MEEILDPKKLWNITCAAWGIHLKRGPATHRPATGRSSQQHRESDSEAGRNQSLRLLKAP
jgi:hypothetical protein